MKQSAMKQEDIHRALDSFRERLELHEAHTWEQVGRCVYCRDCQERLYQGYLPAERRQPKRPPPEPASTTRMRARWGKD